MQYFKLLLVFSHLWFSLVLSTLDLNFGELEYLADHLLPEECRKLIAAAYFKSYNIPNSVGQAGTYVIKFAIILFNCKLQYCLILTL